MLFQHKKIIHAVTVWISISLHRSDDVVVLRLVLLLSITGNLCPKQQIQSLDQCPEMRQPEAIIMVIL